MTLGGGRGDGRGTLEVARPVEVEWVGHRDLGPWNIVFDGTEVVDFIDWDAAPDPGYAGLALAGGARPGRTHADHRLHRRLVCGPFLDVGVREPTSSTCGHGAWGSWSS